MSGEYTLVGLETETDLVRVQVLVANQKQHAVYLTIPLFVSIQIGPILGTKSENMRGRWAYDEAKHGLFTVSQA